MPFEIVRGDIAVNPLPIPFIVADRLGHIRVCE
jgi:hypothetical protein